MPIFASDGTPEDIKAKLEAAGDGDTVTIPLGTFNWTTSMSATVTAQNVTLKGAGTSEIGGGDQTIIVDSFNSSSPLLLLIVPSDGVFRMTGLTIRSGDLDPVKENGIVYISGPGNAQIDHIHFDNHTAADGHEKMMWIGNGIYGVVHSCIMDFAANSSIYVGNGAGSDGQGNAAWAAPTAFGSANFIFFEDNLYRASVFAPIRMVDVYSAGRTVLRFNTVQGGAGLEVHDTGHSGDDRGARASEQYGNAFTALPDQITPPFDMARISSGANLIWGNSNEAENLKNIFYIDAIRRSNTVYAQAATPNGWGYAGTQFNGTGSDWDGGTDNGTDTLRGYPNIDQPGRGQGDLLAGSFPAKINDTTGTIAWPNQALEPVYIWANTGLVPHSGYGGAIYANASDGRVVADRDYYAQASGIQTSSNSPFDGTSGTGWGPIALRPEAPVTPGVAYWATDEGSWNNSESNPEGVDLGGASGRLYVADDDGDWQLYYTPYTYPHPLRSGSVVSDPELSPAGGEYEGNQVVEITTDTEGAEIRYTTDGSEPSPDHGTIYSSPIGVTSDITIKAIAYKEGFADSQVITEEYVITGPSEPSEFRMGRLTLGSLRLAS